MSKQPNTTQKKTFKAFYALIFIELSIIGLIKLSIGEIFSFPITFLFGDGFVVFFVLLAVFSFLYFFLKNKVTYKRKIIVPLLVALVIILLVALYSLIVGDFNNDALYFKGQITNYFTILKTNLDIAQTENIYFYKFGGVIGESVALLFALLSKTVAIIVITFLLAASVFVLAYPFLKAFVLYLKKVMQIKRRRAEIIREAARFEEIEEVIEHIKVEEEAKENIEPVHVEVAEEEEEQFVTGFKVVGQKTVTETAIPKITDAMNDPTIPTLDFDDEEVKPINEQAKDEDEDFVDLQVVVQNEVQLEEAVPLQTDALGESQEDEEISLTPINAFHEVKEEAPAPINRELEKPVTTAPESTEKDADFTPPKLPEEKPIVKAPIKAEVKPALRIYENYVAPPLDLLNQIERSQKMEENELHAERNKDVINQAFSDFGVGAEVVGYTIGAAFTRFDVQTDASVSVNAINPFIKDISQRLRGVATRYEQVVLGRTTSGLEVPNAHRTIVSFRECLEALPEKRKKITIPLGKDVAGEVIYASFSEFPHLLVAGATGSGKSVFVHSVLMALIMQHSPDELRLLIIDPKRVELSKYNDIPHLLGPIVKEPSEAKIALMRLVEDMQERYKELERESASSIEEYNEIMEALGRPLMPYIIVIVDEYADLYESEKEIASPILSLAQKSRAAGINLLIATQRPSVQIITGVIKANLPSRVAFATASNVDSQTIIGVGGAEQLLGYGDMLVEANLGSQRKGLVRLQGSFVRTLEIIRVVKYLRDNYATSYDPRYTDLEERQTFTADGFESAENEPEYAEILAFILTQDRISMSRIQQVFNIGFPRAKRFYETFVDKGIIERTDDTRSSRGALVLGLTNKEED